MSGFWGCECLSGWSGKPHFEMYAYAISSMRHHRFSPRGTELDFRLTNGRHPAWGKIKWIQENLSQQEWTLWVDADTVMLKEFPSIKIPDHDFMIGHDDHGLNSGVFFIRNCDWSRQFLDAVWNYDGPDWYWGSPWEQMAIERLAEKPENARHIKVVDHPVWNSNVLKEDTVIYHPAGVHPLEKRLELLKKAVEGIRA